MSFELAIDHDMTCLRCGYNLRGLPVKHRCPECGLPTILTAARFERTISWGDHLYAPVAMDLECPLDGVLFVQDCIRFALTMAAKRAGRRTHVGACEICDAVREYARAYFNDEAEALDLLHEWGVRRSDDVGHIVFGMVRRGLMRARPDDSPDDFSGLFTLENLFAPREGVG